VIGAGVVALIIAVSLLLLAPGDSPVVLCDPSTPSPSVPYQVPTPGGTLLPGNEQLPPICLHAMRACGYSLDPGTMTWRPRGTSAP
jgi:hypothetical protein